MQNALLYVIITVYFYVMYVALKILSWVKVVTSKKPPFAIDWVKIVYFISANLAGKDGDFGDRICRVSCPETLPLSSHAILSL